MPLGNPNVWQKFGASYHELTSTSGAAAEQQQQQASTSGRGSSRYGGAGRPSNATAKGAGTFQLEVRVPAMHFDKTLSRQQVARLNDGFSPSKPHINVNMRIYP